MRAVLVALAACSSSRGHLLGQWGGLMGGPHLDYAWAQHDAVGVAIYFLSSGEPLHCTDVLPPSTGTPAIDISAAGAQPGSIPIVASGLSPDVPGATIGNVGPSITFDGPWVRGTVDLGDVSPLISGSFTAFTANADPSATSCANGVSTCPTAGQQCTCLSLPFSDVPFCE